MGRTPAEREAARIEYERARKEWAQYWARQMPPSEEQERRMRRSCEATAKVPSHPSHRSSGLRSYLNSCG